MDAMDERIQMAKELITILGSNDSETIDYESMQKTANAWMADCDAVRRQVKENIKALTKELETEQEQSTAADTKVKEDLEKVKEEAAAAQELKSQVSQQVAALRSKLTETERSADTLAEERSKKKEETTQDVANLRYKINLYSHVAKIKWDYSADPDDIRGYITNKDKVTPFQLSKKQNSRFFIANHLWDLMDSS